MASSSTPNSHASSASVSNLNLATANKPPRILACVLCQHRKIKCDRLFPCANCIKANIKCTPSTPAPARKRRRPNQDLQERLARCEEMLKAYASEKPESTSPRPAHANVSDDLRWQPAGKLVKEDGNLRFVDNPLLGVIFDEVRAMREIMAYDDSDDGIPDCMTPDDNSDLLLGGDTPGVKIESLWPAPAHMFRLWQIYLDRVNPLTKIIHVPSLQPYVAEAATGLHSVPKNIEALLFSIFLMAVVSLTPDECRGLLGYSREEALQRYSSGVRLSLLRMGFLRSHDVTILQALVIYLTSLQGRYNRHAVWILNGVAIRVAQKMGLHRDGEALGLSPFDCEMRRRLWWQIIMVDAKYAMISGLSHTLLPTNCDTKAPKNVNDADIFPSATEHFQDREGPTEMIFCLLTHKFAKFLLDMPGFEGVAMIPETDSVTGSRIGPTEEQLTEYRRGVGQLREELMEILDRYCDPTAGPVHEMAITMRGHLLDKLNELMTAPKDQPEWGGEVKSAKDNAFKLAIGTFEHNEANYASTKDKGFAWFSLLHFQLDIFMYMAGQLCRRTEGTLVERAWRQVGVVYSFHPELFDMTNKNYSALAAFTLRAWAKREQVLFNCTGHVPEVPFYVEKLRVCVPHHVRKEEQGGEEEEEEEEEQTPPNPYTSPGFVPIGTMGSTGTMSTDNPLGQFLSYLDAPALEWDMFTGQPMTHNNGQLGPGFGPFGMGPSADW
ncbi:activator of stress genes 1 [Chaetomidium leptoderma]|uniref:Activator of stress genes 1 n=1 Tax=Chaetomidium leptoderma TaxID=669021 RepID=A0AAN6ZW96_9PEZI|nr:activator of stress genes 1 [Chaetomidium leptoderma]